jgi:hypothetical protein
MMDDICDDYENKGIIEKCPFSPWASPALLVKRGSSDKTPNRLVIDLRQLNMRTLSETNALPRIDTTL